MNRLRCCNLYNDLAWFSMKLHGDQRWWLSIKMEPSNIFSWWAVSNSLLVAGRVPARCLPRIQVCIYLILSLYTNLIYNSLYTFILYMYIMCAVIRVEVASLSSTGELPLSQATEPWTESDLELFLAPWRWSSNWWFGGPQLVVIPGRNFLVNPAGSVPGIDGRPYATTPAKLLNWLKNLGVSHRKCHFFKAAALFTKLLRFACATGNGYWPTALGLGYLSWFKFRSELSFMWLR